MYVILCEYLCKNAHVFEFNSLGMIFQFLLTSLVLGRLILRLTKLFVMGLVTLGMT